MMRIVVLLTFFSSFSFAQAEIEQIWMSSVVLLSDSVDQNLEQNQSKYTFEFTTLDGSKKRMIYSIDGVEGKAKLENNSFEIVTTPGKHIFQFYYAENYEEVYSDSLEIQAGHHSRYRVNMNFSLNIQFNLDKPVIYLYPEEKTKVSVELDIKGEALFYYPSYENNWKFEALPNGDLIFGNRTYNYLFWESEQSGSLSEDELQSGFNLKKDEVVAFLEEKLTQAGLNSKEQADFITYWGPRLSANELNFVRFEFNETCDRYAELNITPKPDHVYRIYMKWMPIDKELNVVPQTIETMNRDGFCVLEWGGSEINQIPSTSLVFN